MSLSETLLLAFSTYGLSALFVVTVMAAVGLPLPVTLLLIVVGSFVAQGDLNLLAVVALVSFAAVIGDQLGYAIGRWSGDRFVVRMTDRLGGAERMAQAAAAVARWGSLSVFLTRWLLTPLGPVLNLTCGITRFSYPTFLVWDILGETTWVLIYVLLGKFFSDRVEAISATMGDLTWAILGIAGVMFFGWRLLKSWRTEDKRAAKPASDAPPPP
jgi:membrane protein DedA with SNARE-associated domain